MIDLCSLLHPFNPTLWLEYSQCPSQSPKEIVNDEYNAVLHISHDENPSSMKQKSSSAIDVGALLNPIHPTLWLEHSKFTPPPRTAQNKRCQASFP